MGYLINGFQNASSWDTTRKPDIIIKDGDDCWEEAIKRWLNGESPTDNPLWKRGVFATTTWEQSCKSV